MRLREAERRSGKKISSKKKKKHKRGKKGQPVDSSEEDDIPVQHSVSSAFDLPEVRTQFILRQTNCSTCTRTCLWFGRGLAAMKIVIKYPIMTWRQQSVSSQIFRMFFCGIWGD